MPADATAPIGGALTRLRWKLTLSHLAAVAVTLMAMTAVITIIAIGGIGAQTDPAREPALDARQVASAIEALVGGSAPSTELNVILQALATGRLHLGGGGPPLAAEASRRSPWAWQSLTNMAYIVVVGADGRLLGSSDPAGVAFAPPERAEWSALVAAALAGERDPRRLVASRPGGIPAALGAAPVLDARDRPIAAVIVAKATLPPPDRAGNLRRALGIFITASATVLAGASIFALAAASLVAFLLSRGLVARLERLGRAADAFAAGDLNRRVDAGPADEVGHLARRWNTMADQLAATFAELAAQKQRAETLLQSKRDLVANVSHELRTPLASIRGHLEAVLLRGETVDAQGQTDLTIAHREAERLGGLIDDLFTLSTTEAGALPLTLGPVELGEVIEEVAGSVRAVARRERQVTIVTASAPNLPPALADRARVAQVLGNLVRNALRHTPEGGLISLRAEARAGRMLITVEDTGDGIPAEAVPHVFERFYRGDDARDRASGGAGLGLAIVRELVEVMGGTVAAESVPGAGARFSFTLPLAPPE
ncbi:MAG: HAMP domain-containing protein [Chloroflexi bacterium]|nr:HAMP domain-containing protein [Chloroflexota bacterium]